MNVSEIKEYFGEYAVLEEVPMDNTWMKGLINYLNNDYGVIVCNPGPPRHDLLLIAGDSTSNRLYVAAWNPIGNANAIGWTDISNLQMFIVKKYK